MAFTVFAVYSRRAVIFMTAPVGSNGGVDKVILRPFSLLGTIKTSPHLIAFSLSPWQHTATSRLALNPRKQQCCLENRRLWWNKSFWLTKTQKTIFPHLVLPSENYSFASREQHLEDVYRSARLRVDTGTTHLCSFRIQTCSNHLENGHETSACTLMLS